MVDIHEGDIWVFGNVGVDVAWDAQVDDEFGVLDILREVALGDDGFWGFGAEDDPVVMVPVVLQGGPVEDVAGVLAGDFVGEEFRSVADGDVGELFPFEEAEDFPVDVGGADEEDFDLWVGGEVVHACV